MLDCCWTAWKLFTPKYIGQAPYYGDAFIRYLSPLEINWQVMHLFATPCNSSQCNKRNESPAPPYNHCNRHKVVGTIISSPIQYVDVDEMRHLFRALKWDLEESIKDGYLYEFPIDDRVAYRADCLLDAWRVSSERPHKGTLGKQSWACWISRSYDFSSFGSCELS